MNGTSKNIIAELIENRKLIKSLAKNDFKIKFAGSYLGTLWAFVQPVITVLIYWFVFDKDRRKSKYADSASASLCLVAGRRNCALVFLF